MRKRIFITNRSGFTMIELTISILIVVVLLSLVIANFRLGNQNEELKLKGIQVVSDIRQMQNDALSAVALSDGTIPRAYGVHFDDNTNSYILFAKTGGTDWLYSSGNKQDIKEVSLGPHIIVPSGGMNDPQEYWGPPQNICHTVQVGLLDIVFTVPAGVIYVDGLQPVNNDPNCQGIFNPSTVELRHQVSSQSIKIETNWISGQISATDFIN